MKYNSFLSAMQLDVTTLAKPVRQPVEASESVFDTLVSDSVIKDLRSALFSMRADERSDWIRIGIALKTLGDQGRGLWLEWSATSPKFEPAVAAETWQTFAPTATGYQAVFAEAARQGWLNPARHSDSNLGFDSLEEVVAEILDANGNVVEKQLRYKFLTTEELAMSEPMEWLVDNWLPKAAVGMVYGQTQSGKSFEITDMLYAVSRGVSWCGNDTIKTKIAIVAAEGAEGFGNRLKAYGIAKNIPLSEIDIIGLKANPDFLNKKDADDIILGLKGSGVGVVLIDTFSATFTGSENDSSDISLAIREYRRISKALDGALVLSVHHEGKTANGSRGSSAIKAAMDVELYVTYDKDTGLRNISISKMKEGSSEIPSIDFYLSYIVVGFDAKGKPIVSCGTDHGSI